MTGQNNGKELKERIDRQLEDLIQSAESARASEAFQEYLKVSAKFHKYSFGNIMLIAVQRPDATKVAGYRKWQELGRQVLKGEKGIAILAPVPRYAEIETEDGETKKAQTGIWFKGVHVFDISQTEGDEIPELDWQGDGRASKVEEALLQYAAELQIDVQEYDYRGGALGWSAGGKIGYTDNGNVPRTIAHELVHELTPEWKEKVTAVREGLTDAAAAIICLHFGVDVRVSSANYIASWNENPKDLLPALEKAQRVASSVIENVESRIKEGAK